MAEEYHLHGLSYSLVLFALQGTFVSMTRIILITITLMVSFSAHSQETTVKKLNAGVELDVLPYITGGYFAAAWVGKDHIRVRTLTANVNKPDLFVKEGFTNNKVTAYALLGDYFLKEGWKGWWTGTGVVYWKSSIQTDAKLSTAHFENWFLNGSLGYNFKLGRKFYVGPWAGLHIKIAGDKNVPVDNKTYTPPLFNPEASVKLGAYF